MSFWECVVTWLNGHQAIVGGSIGGLCTLTAAVLVTWRLSRVMKRTDYYLEFTKRYHEILKVKHALEQAELKKECDSKSRESDARQFYHQFFDLMLDEFYAFRLGLLHEKYFVEWMKWRRHQSHDASFAVCGVSYLQGFDQWCQIGPLPQDECTDFLKRIHGCHDDGAVEREVRLVRSRWRRMLSRLQNAGGRLLSRHEMVLGFAIATACWAGIFLWQSRSR